MKLLSAHPHHVGSAYNKPNAEWILAKFKEWGWITCRNFRCTLSDAKRRIVELVAPGSFIARLQDLRLLSTRHQATWRTLPTYNAYSIDGDVTALLVYVNYGLPEDYERLERMGISVKDVLWLHVMEHRGAALNQRLQPNMVRRVFDFIRIPAATGTAREMCFQLERFAERWSAAVVLWTWHCIRRSAYTGVGATNHAKRLSINDVQTLTKFPSFRFRMPMLNPCLKHWTVRFPRWMAWSLANDVYIGPGNAKVHLKVSCNWDRKRSTTFIASLHGAQYPDEWIIRGIITMHGWMERKIRSRDRLHYWKKREHSVNFCKKGGNRSEPLSTVHGMARRRTARSTEWLRNMRTSWNEKQHYTSTRTEMAGDISVFPVHTHSKNL